MFMVLIASVAVFVLFRWWYITLPLLFVFWMLGSEHEQADRVKFRGYDPKEWTQEEVEKAVSIVVPVHTVDYKTVTLANKAKRSFDGRFYVVCVATETILEGESKWVLGVKQRPYVMGKSMTIKAGAIQTESFVSMSDDLEANTNLTKCVFYANDATAESAKDAIEDAWIQVTPRGAFMATRMGYTWMHLPMASNVPDYQSAW